MVKLSEKHLILAAEKHLNVSQETLRELERIKEVRELAEEARRELRELWEGSEKVQLEEQAQ